MTTTASATKPVAEGAQLTSKKVHNTTALTEAQATPCGSPTNLAWVLRTPATPTTKESGEIITSIGEDYT